MGSPTRLPSAIASVWHPARIINASLLCLYTSAKGIIFFSIYDGYGAQSITFYKLTDVRPFIIKSLTVKVPVLSKQQILTFPAFGILNGSVQNICFFIIDIME